jgi:hypothetical protein
MLILTLANGTELRVAGARRVRRFSGQIYCEDEFGKSLELVEEELVVSYAIAPDPKPARSRSRKQPKRKAASA